MPPHTSTTTNAPSDLKARLKTSYDAIAETYNNTFNPLHNDIRLDYLHRLLDLLTPNSSPSTSTSTSPSKEPLPSSSSSRKKVLELGCGAGHPATSTLLTHPTQPPLHITANDLSSTQIALATQNLAPYLSTNTLTLIQGDMSTLAFPPATFDAVTAFYSIIHLPRGEQTALMHKVATWLKPGGLFLANFAEREGESVVEERWLGEKEGWMFWSGWGVEGSLKMVGECGLEVLVSEVREGVEDATFLWVIARKGGAGGMCHG